MAAVLVLGDDHDLADIVAEVLTNAGHTVRIAGSLDVKDGGVDGETFDVIVANGLAAERAGATAIRALRRVAPAPTLILLAGRERAFGMVAAELGADRVLSKPVDFAQLLDAVASTRL